MMVDVESLAAYTAMITSGRDTEIERSQEADTSGRCCEAQHHWEAARAYRMALSALHYYTGGQFGEMLDTQPVPPWVAEREARRGPRG